MKREHRLAYRKTTLPVDVEMRMQKLLTKIEQEYDFQHFSLENFRRYLEIGRGRSIHLIPWRMPTCISGVWMSAREHDFVFYDTSAPPLHQLHIQLHEFAHMLCGHETWTIVSEANLSYTQIVRSMLETLTSLLSHNEPLPPNPLMRFPCSTEKEFEAEILTELIQTLVLRSEETRTLELPIKTSQRMALFYNSMGWV